MASAPTAHVPPQNIEAEESVLGAMLVSEPTLTRVIDEVKLNAADFYLEKHGAIFTCVHDLYAASKPVDELSVTEALVQQMREALRTRSDAAPADPAAEPSTTDPRLTHPAPAESARRRSRA